MNGVRENVEPCLKNNKGIVCWCVGYSDEELDKLLKKHPDWYRSSANIE